MRFNAGGQVFCNLIWGMAGETDNVFQLVCPELEACSRSKGLFTRREGYPCARVTLASRLKLALVYKQISQVGLPYHLGQFY